MKKIMTSVSALALSFFLSACDTNIFAPVDKADPAEKAASYMDQGKTDEAISVLNNALQDEPENYQLISLLASAKAQKAGLDTLDIAIRLADSAGDDSASEDSGESNALTSLFVILPEVTQSNRDLMLECVNLLNSIPEASRTNADIFKSTLFNAAFTAMQAKYFDADGDGQFTQEELENLDDESASAILDSLLNAENAAQYFQGEGSDAVAAEAVAEIRSQIDAQEGENTAEKLRNFLASGTQQSPQ
jgi:hypothetical protein